ncbi:hypothetical protein [uncultured Eubacterium sp.]|uniref:hypothetical protein n=1 Tax=uncultured Eubacterium sp. TaxID=165185 RepID=UPI0017AED301|nr:hypothetical protein [uncultured Eubacterium sp.]HII09123.1 hypothetical protein [Methanosphaera sp.]
MYIEWRFNDEAKGISLEEFERDYEDFFGYMMIKLGDYQLGWAEKSSPIDEGDENISYYIISLIKCGITLLLGQEFKVQLISSNLLEIHVYSDMGVYIDVIRIDSNEILCSYNITFIDLKDEIMKNYQKYIDEIQRTNRDLIEASVVKNTMKYYDIFTRLLD